MKKKLGKDYCFSRMISDREIRQLQKTNPIEFEPQIIASLVVGCVKMECCIYKTKVGLQLGYDVFVKDDPGAVDWIFFDCPNFYVSTKETDMFTVLNQVVKQNGLSYTECCFKKLEGKSITNDFKEKEVYNQ